jgi:hypothetical protein
MAANTPTLNKLIELVQLVSQNHKMVADFRFGPLWNRNALRDLKTPYVWLEEKTSKIVMGNGSHKTGEYTFTLYCMDRIQKDESNYDEILSDTKFILDTIMTELDQHPLFVDLGISFPVDSTISYEPVYEETDTNSNGHSCEFTLRFPIRYTPCNVPINPLGTYTYSLNNNVYNYSIMGATGPQGPQGQRGYDGVTGATGSQGSTGQQGATGSQGITGAGVQGSQGSIGPQGNQGNQGSFGPTGSGGALGYYGSFFDTTTQTNPTASTANIMKLNSTAEANGVTNDSGSQIVFLNGGVYNIQFSAQFDRTNSGTDVIDIWLRKNGTDVVWSNTEVVMAGGAASSAIVPSWNFMLTLAANDYIQLMWSAPDTHIRVLSVGTQSAPIRPAIPSVILTAQQVMYTQVGPQGNQGNQGGIGQQGVQGVQGVQGFTGAQGAQGNQGNVGATVGTVGISLNGNGAYISSGSKGYITMPYACTITGWYLVANATGSIVIDIEKGDFTTFPVNTSIVGSATPSLVSQQKNSSTTLTGWTTSVAQNDVIEFTVVSNTTVTNASLNLRVLK